MKCKNCGADYRTRELKCPYCGTENLMGRIWLIEREEARHDYEHAEMAARKRGGLYVYNKILNRIMVLSIGFLLLLFLGMTLFTMGIKLYHESYSKSHKEEMLQNMQAYYDNRDYDGLYDYMGKWQLFGEEQYAMSQAALLGWSYNRMHEGLMCLTERYGEQQKNNKDYYDDNLDIEIEYLLRLSYELYHTQAGIYSDQVPENESIYKEMGLEAESIWTGMFGLTEEETAMLKEGDSYLKSEMVDTLLPVIRERRAWM